MSNAHNKAGDEGLFETHSRPGAVESATERAALLCASTSMAPPLILSTRCECESSATPSVMSLQILFVREGLAVVLVLRPLSKKDGTTLVRLTRIGNLRPSVLASQTISNDNDIDSQLPRPWVSASHHVVRQLSA